ncbi:MAG: patatin-like phospholipase family protein [Candidatus Krumholzibacteriia bacterium]
MRPWLILTLLLSLSTAPATLAADDPPAAQRPRIGLVLSGGGARGAAHIGVLAVLEELRIPVDAIAGTSMGAIVGGLYASGMSPDEMQAAIAAIDWRSVFDDAPPRQDRSFRRKEDQYDPLFALELGWTGRRMLLPSGLIAGQKLDIILRELVLNTYDITDFDRLPVRYRAVAADLADGQAVVLRRGDLVQAMRASMAIPGAFTPVDLDGHQLVDGGMAKNLPVDVVRGMGVDIVIAVDIGTPVGMLDGSESLLGVVRRTLDVLSKANVGEQKKLLTDRDLLLEPDLGTIETASFDRLGEAVAVGRRAAEARAADLSRFSVSEAEYAALRACQRRPRLADPMVDRIVVGGNRRVPARMIERRMTTQAGRPLDLGRLRRDLTDIYRVGEFARVDARLTRADSSNTLEIDARRSPGARATCASGCCCRAISTARANSTSWPTTGSASSTAWAPNGARSAASAAPWGCGRTSTSRWSTRDSGSSIRR